MTGSRGRFIPLWIALALALASCAKKPALISITRGKLLMGTLIEVTVVDNDSAHAESLLDSAFAELDRIDAMASDFEDSSYVGRMNDLSEDAEQNGTTFAPFAVPPGLFGMLAYSEYLTRRTDGAFDITTGTETHLWREGEDDQQPPSSAAIDSAVLLTGPSHIRLDSANSTVTLDPGTLIDLGGIAKGYAVDRTVALLKRLGAEGALVNGSGDMAVFGSPPGMRGKGPDDVWKIGIRHPRRGPMDYFGIIYLSSGAVATSGDYERGYAIGDTVYGHILNPRTGRGAQSGCVSTTVTAPTCELADGLSTAVFVLGPDSGRAVLSRFPGVEGLIVTERDSTLTAWPTKGFLSIAAIDTSLVRVAQDSAYGGGATK